MKKLLLFLFGSFILLLVLILRPVPIVVEDQALELSGIVSEIYEGGLMDVVIKLNGDHRRFYINRGLEKGLNLEDLEAQLLGNKVKIKYPKYWTPLDWNNRIRHISKLEVDQKVLFNELK